MKWIWGAAAAVLVAATGAAWSEDPPAPQVGDKAPNFKLKGTDDKEYTLDQFKGKSAVIVAWYPKALTGG